jgi:hypothetical protein
MMEGIERMKVEVVKKVVCRDEAKKPPRFAGDRHAGVRTAAVQLHIYPDEAAMSLRRRESSIFAGRPLFRKANPGNPLPCGKVGSEDGMGWSSWQS